MGLHDTTMNAPLPTLVTRGTARRAGETIARLGGPEAARLAHRLATETRGEVLFDAASRGRYATDASIYQAMPLGVFVPRRAEDVAAAIDIARELHAPLLSRGAGTSQCGQTTGTALVIDTSKHLRKVLAVDPRRDDRRGRAGARPRRPQRPPEAARPVVPGRRLDQRPGDDRRHGRQQLVRLALDRLRQHGAQRARHRRLAERRQHAVVRPGGRARRPRARDRRLRSRPGRSPKRTRSRRAGRR